MVNSILQANINHSRDGHDILLQTMAEGDFSLAVVSEPYYIPADHPHWVSSKEGNVAIVWRRTKNVLPCSPFMKGDRFVAIKWGDMVVVGTYLSPNTQAGVNLRMISRRWKGGYHKYKTNQST